MTGVLMRRGKFGYRHTHREHHVTAEAEMSDAAVKPRNAKDF